MTDLSRAFDEELSKKAGIPPDTAEYCQHTPETGQIVPHTGQTTKKCLKFMQNASKIPEGSETILPRGGREQQGARRASLGAAPLV